MKLSGPFEAKNEQFQKQVLATTELHQSKNKQETCGESEEINQLNSTNSGGAAGERVNQ